MSDTIKLTQFSHGYGCGCKIAPAVLDEILKGNESGTTFPGLLVGNDSRDDAAVMEIGNGLALVSTTDFFMPIVDDPFEFGRIAATNAISDIYAMGGKPNLAIAILGWPVDKLAPEIAARVVAGGRSVCEAAGIPLAGGHSIDSPEPIFGLAVNGIVRTDRLLRNDTAREGDLLFLTKPLGVGIITTAEKMGKASSESMQTAIGYMSSLNRIGERLGEMAGVHAVTDVTGFGLFGHLLEMTSGSGLAVQLDLKAIPEIPGLNPYLEQHTIPAITYRNWNSYGHLISETGARELQLCCDPQTSGGLLIAVDETEKEGLINLMKEFKVAENCLFPIGRMIAPSGAILIQCGSPIE
ncbi:MAG: selenide, water dikinase SelD [Bacteroidia bacterium]|nr:selenide, water dikinase SelD [Bacteroidia bacterium]